MRSLFDNVGTTKRNQELPPSLSYLICSCERTGSTLSGQCADRHRDRGASAVVFQPRRALQSENARILGNAKDDDNYLDKVMVAATTSNGVFGAKVHWQHLLNLVTRVERRLQLRGGTVPHPCPSACECSFPTCATSGSRAAMRLPAPSRIIASRRPVAGSSIPDGSPMTPEGKASLASTSMKSAHSFAWGRPRMPIGANTFRSTISHPSRWSMRNWSRISRERSAAFWRSWKFRPRPSRCLRQACADRLMIIRANGRRATGRSARKRAT